MSFIVVSDSVILLLMFIFKGDMGVMVLVPVGDSDLLLRCMTSDSMSLAFFVHRASNKICSRQVLGYFWRSASGSGNGRNKSLNCMCKLLSMVEHMIPLPMFDLRKWSTIMCSSDCVLRL